MNKNSRRFKVITVVATALMSACLSILPAEAYYWGYSPYGGGSNWMWMAQSLAYPLTRNYGYSGYYPGYTSYYPRYNNYSNYYSPYGLASNLIWTASSLASLGLQNRQYNNYNNNYNYSQRNSYNGDYVYGDPAYGNQNQPRPFVGPAAQQMVNARRINGYTNWADPQVTSALPNSAPAYIPDAQPMQQDWQSSNSLAPMPQLGALPVSGSSYDAQQPQPVKTSGRRSGRKHAGSTPANGGSSPLANGFVDLVNTKYDGDIGRALADPQTRSYAHAVGLVNSTAAPGSDLGQDRVQLIRQILNDKREDAGSRVAAARMLLTH